MSGLSDLAIIWSGILAFAIYAYVVLDGFDLGIGMLAPFAAGDEEQETMIASIAPVWDGNETWLVLGGGGLMAAFPLAYSVLLPALYAPIIAMLLALIFRGVAFEFRHRHEGHRRLWTFAFVLGSYVATLAQGIAVGAFVQGISVEGRAYAGGWFDWLTPFSLFTGAALVLGYALLGACFLIMKTKGVLQERMFTVALPLGIAVFASVVAVSLWTPFIEPAIAARWFSWPNLALPVAGAAAGASDGARAFQKPRGGVAGDAVCDDDPAFPDLLFRHRRQRLSLRRAARDHGLSGGGARREPSLPSGRHSGPDPDHSCLHGLFVLGLSRQDRSGQRVSLSDGLFLVSARRRNG